MSETPARMLAGDVLSEEPSEWTPDQIEASVTVADDLVSVLQAHLDTIEGLALEAGRYGSDSWSCPSSAVVDVGSDGLEGLKEEQP